MKRLTAVILTALLAFAVNATASNQKNSQNNNNNKGKTTAASKTGSQKNSQGKQKGSVQQQVIINMNRPSSGGHNRNYPSQKPAQKQINNNPAYGKLQLTPVNQGRRLIKNNTQLQPVSRPIQSKNGQNEVKTANPHPGVNTASVTHHHPYEPNYVRKKLQKLGVVSAPGYIINRDEVIHTDRAHSIIAYPKEGFDKRPLNAAAFSPRHFNDKAVRGHMSLITAIDWQNRIRGFNQTETRANFYYWHKDKDFNYCHYIDNSGYHWYGWYAGSTYFWTRYFNNRWWWYDADYDRWCFWNDGFWWWQDPYHMGDLYCYNDADYIPCNSADDNVTVTVPDNNNTQTFTSPDNSRIVKVVMDTQDAFLYDPANPPAFNPVYLASGVQDVMFSDPNNGRPLEIILKLNDKSFDMFDGNGNPYNPGASEGDQSSTNIQ